MQIPRLSGFTILGITKLLIALRFYAVGTFLETIADLFGVSKAVVCNITSEVSYLIASKLKDRYICMPNNEREILNQKAKYFRIDQFPLIIGTLDGSHIRVYSFGGPNAEIYRNRKTFFSINCQIIASADVSTYFNKCKYSL